MPPFDFITKTKLTLKVIELFLACTCMGLNVAASINQPEGFVLTCIVFGGYIIIFSGMIVGILYREKVPRLVDMFFSLVGMALFVAAGGVNISYFRSHIKYQVSLKKMGLAAGSLSILNAFFLLLDTALTYRFAQEYLPN